MINRTVYIWLTVHTTPLLLHKILSYPLSFSRNQSSKFCHFFPFFFKNKFTKFQRTLLLLENGAVIYVNWHYTVLKAAKYIIWTRRIVRIFAKIRTYNSLILCYFLGNGNYTEAKMWHDFSFKSMWEVSYKTILNFDNVIRIFAILY